MISSPAPKTIPACISQQAEQFSHRLAVFDTSSSLTFGELNAASSRVAQVLLRARGSTPEAVLLLFDVDTNLVVAGLGTMKAGKFYVGVDPFFPPERIVQVMKDARVSVILTESQHETLALKLAGTTRLVVNIENMQTYCNKTQLDFAPILYWPKRSVICLGIDW